MATFVLRQPMRPPQRKKNGQGITPTIHRLLAVATSRHCLAYVYLVSLDFPLCSFSLPGPHACTALSYCPVSLPLSACLSFRFFRAVIPLARHCIALGRWREPTGLPRERDGAPSTARTPGVGHLRQRLRHYAPPWQNGRSKTTGRQKRGHKPKEERATRERES